jgi:aryl-alcohol dehydrogenase-like predicted oxidoreductase
MGFGAMRLTGPGVFGEPADPEECRRVLRRAIDLGVNFIDTADSYGPEVSELLIAEALYPYPADLVIATKGGQVRPGPGQWEPDGRPEHLRAACEGSLRRLRLESIALYQLHRPDPKVPYAESVGALVDLQTEGKIQLIGISNVNERQLELALAMIAIASVQNRFNLVDRESEAIVDICESRGLAFIPWFPLATGELAQPKGPLRRAAEHHHATPAQIALAWLLARSPVMLPIPGTSSVSHVEENVAAAGIELSREELQELAAA